MAQVVCLHLKELWSFLSLSQLLMFGEHSWAALENISSVLDGSVQIRG